MKAKLCDCPLFPKIAVLCGLADHYYWPLAEHTIFENKLPYCLRHHYHLEFIYGVRPEFADPSSHAGGFSWSRLRHLLEMLESGLYEWVWTVGADTLITNMKIRLEDIIAEADPWQPMPRWKPIPNSPAPPGIIKWDEPLTGLKGKHLLICSERATPIQADSFLVRCSPEGAAYVRDILAHYELYKHHPWVENQAMIDLHVKWSAITHIVPQWKLNTVDYSRWYSLRPQYRENTDAHGNRGNWKRGDFLIHWPAASLEQRLGFYAKYRQQIVS